jgi:hypothetical protein
VLRLECLETSGVKALSWRFLRFDPFGNYLALQSANASHKPVRQLVFRFLTVMCALYVSGAHWAALQTLAWTGMLVTRTQEVSVKEAVRTTFDGEHPCSLCHAVEEGRRQEKEKEPAPIVEQIAKLSFLRPQPITLPEPTSTPLHYLAVLEFGRTRMSVPPTPPPRLA